MGREPARAREERSADSGTQELNRGCREPLAQSGRRARERTERAGWRSHRDRCFKICFLMIPAMLQPRPAWNAGRQADGRAGSRGLLSCGKEASSHLAVARAPAAVATAAAMALCRP